MQLAFILLTTGFPVTPRPRGQNPDQYVFAHNPAAWIGVAICVFLLLLWFKGEKSEDSDGQNDQSDKPVRQRYK